MIRAAIPGGWRLIEHPEHARLAGQFARRWKNAHFPPPEPFAHVLDAVYRHDDSWGPRDRAPTLTPEGQPSAFSRELVGTYDAFEEIEMEPYLNVRGAATEAAAERDPYAAILISMHTVNLLTEQADLTGLDDASRAIHTRFIDGQRRRQAELRELLAATPLAQFTSDAALQRGFEFLQACDSFSLYACSDFPDPGHLRHAHPDAAGVAHPVSLLPQGGLTFRLDPFVLDEDGATFELRYRDVLETEFASDEQFQTLYHAAPVQTAIITVIK